MKLPLQTFVSTALLVATAGLAAADADPPPLYYMVSPLTGESWEIENRGEVPWWPNQDGERSGDPDTYYDSLEGEDNDGDGANFAGEYEFQSHLEDDYEMHSSVVMTQTLVRHTFRAGFEGADGADGRLYVSFYDEAGETEISSYLINLTGNQGFNTINVYFDSDLAVLPKGRVRFEWRSSQVTKLFGLMEAEPQLGYNQDDLLWDGVNQIDPSNAFGGISMAMVTVDIPAPGSFAPMALAGFGLLTSRRKR